MQQASALVTDTLRRVAREGVVHTLNFHSTPADRAGAYDAQLARYGEIFRSLAEEDLDGLFEGRPWPYARPGLVAAFFNGYRNNYDVAAPLLERYGLRGWFFVPSGFIDVSVADQKQYAAHSKIRTRPDEYEGRIAMTWDEVRDLRDRGHVIACHTRSHKVTAAADLSPEALRAEIALSQADFCRELGHEVRTFAWIYGSGYRINPKADALLTASGYRYLFSNDRLQRLG